MRQLGCTLLALGFLALTLAGCGRQERASSVARASGTNAVPISPSSAPPSDAPVDTTDDSLSSSDPNLETVLAPLHDVEVVARLDGEVVSVAVEEGRRVAAGAPLARLDERERRARLDEREAEVTRAESAWSRAQRLHAENVISEEQYVAARSEWQIAKARRDQAAIEYERCTVRAPIAGIVAARRVQRGQMVKDGTTLFRISDPDWLRAELLLPEAYRGAVKAGQPVHLIPVVGGTGAVARVTRVNPLVDPASGTFRVVIDLDNRRARLPGGIAVRVEFEPPLPARD